MYENDEDELPDTEERVPVVLHALENVADNITIANLPSNKMEERFLSILQGEGALKRRASHATSSFHWST